MIMKRKIFSILKVICLCFTFIALISSCSKQKGELEVIRPVHIMRVIEPGDNFERSFSGIAKSAQDIKLSFRIGGTVEKINVKVGSNVTKGQMIAHLDPVDAQLRVKQQKALLAQALARLQNAEAEYKRTLALYETDNASKSSLDNVLALFLSSSAAVEAAKKSLELSRQNLHYCYLSAPVSGTIANVPIEEYQTVAAGTEIASLSTTGDALEIILGIPEQLISEIELNKQASVVFDAIRSETFDAKVSEIGVETTETTTYPVTLELTEKDARMRPGMVCDVTFRFSNVADKYIVVPSYSVIGAPGDRNYMWLYDEESERVSQIEVTVGSLTKDGIQVLEGLESGDIVITKGVHNIQEGMKVTPIEEV